MGARKRALDDAAALLRTHALKFPETHEDFPWGESVVKVRKKVFVFLGRSGDGLTISVKLPDSQTFALMMPFATPTGYGLGASGWITAKFPKGENPPVDLLREWIDESFRAVAPKKLVAALDDAPDRRASAPRRKK